jgi:Leucine-rich repeat (LRR) protein
MLIWINVNLYFMHIFSYINVFFVLLLSPINFASPGDEQTKCGIQEKFSPLLLTVNRANKQEYHQFTILIMSEKEASFTIHGLNFLQMKRKEKVSQNEENWNDESNINQESNDGIAKKDRIDDCEVSSMNVENDESSVFKFSVIAIISLLLLTGIVIPAVILTRKSRKDSPKNAAKDFLEKLKPLLTNTSRQELEVPDSVPYLALDWLLNNSNLNEFSLDRQIQRFSMALFFFSTGGRSWKVNQGWLTDVDECLWYQSNDETVCVNGTLRVLSLKYNTLNGLLPNDISLLSSLTYLNLRGNQLRGTIPLSIGALTDLDWLELAENELTGKIPPVGSLTSLMTFDLYFNSFTGSIPSSIVAMKNMTHFSVGDTYLSGSIPSEFGLNTKLMFLDLWGNSFDGFIPSDIGQCTGLTYLNVWRNSLDGSIPSEIGQCKGLKYLSLGNNSLVGSIPSEIGALTYLEYVDVLNTDLTGTIPELLCYPGLDLRFGGNVTCTCC